MKTNLLFFISTSFLAGCATTSSDSAVVYSGDTRCLEQTAPESPKASAVRWCSSRQIFQPNRHTVTLGSTSLFAGTDYEDVKFEKQVGSVTYIGSCIPEIDITDTKTSKPVLVSKLPKALIEACDIKANERGEMVPFARTAACTSVYTKELGPLIGAVFPFKRIQRCNIAVGSKEVFKGSFRYE
jgi:hypothetical protein